MWFELIEKIIKYLILFLIGVLLFIVIHKVYKKCIDGFSISAQPQISDTPSDTSFEEFKRNAILDDSSFDFKVNDDVSWVNPSIAINPNINISPKNLQSAQSIFNYYNQTYDNNPFKPYFDRIEGILQNGLNSGPSEETMKFVSIDLDSFTYENDLDPDFFIDKNKDDYYFFDENVGLILNIANNFTMFDLLFDDNAIHFCHKDNIQKLLKLLNVTEIYLGIDSAIHTPLLTLLYFNRDLFDEQTKNKISKLITIRFFLNFDKYSYSEKIMFKLLHGRYPNFSIRLNSCMLKDTKVKNFLNFKQNRIVRYDTDPNTVQNEIIDETKSGYSTLAELISEYSDMYFYTEEHCVKEIYYNSSGLGDVKTRDFFKYGGLISYPISYIYFFSKYLETLQQSLIVPAVSQSSEIITIPDIPELNNIPFDFKNTFGINTQNFNANNVVSNFTTNKKTPLPEFFSTMLNNCFGDNNGIQIAFNSTQMNFRFIDTIYLNVYPLYHETFRNYINIISSPDVSSSTDVCASSHFSVVSISQNDINISYVLYHFSMLGTDYLKKCTQSVLGNKPTFKPVFEGDTGFVVGGQVNELLDPRTFAYLNRLNVAFQKVRNPPGRSSNLKNRDNWIYWMRRCAEREGVYRDRIIQVDNETSRRGKWMYHNGFIKEDWEFLINVADNSRFGNPELDKVYLKQYLNGPGITGNPPTAPDQISYSDMVIWGQDQEFITQLGIISQVVTNPDPIGQMRFLKDAFTQPQCVQIFREMAGQNMFYGIVTQETIANYINVDIKNLFLAETVAEEPHPQPQPEYEPQPELEYEEYEPQPELEPEDIAQLIADKTTPAALSQPTVSQYTPEQALKMFNTATTNYFQNALQDTNYELYNRIISFGTNLGFSQRIITIMRNKKAIPASISILTDPPIGSPHDAKQSALYIVLEQLNVANSGIFGVIDLRSIYNSFFEQSGELRGRFARLNTEMLELFRDGGSNLGTDLFLDLQNSYAEYYEALQNFPSIPREFSISIKVFQGAVSGGGQDLTHEQKQRYAEFYNEFYVNLDLSIQRSDTELLKCTTLTQDFIAKVDAFTQKKQEFLSKVVTANQFIKEINKSLEQGASIPILNIDVYRDTSVNSNGNQLMFNPIDGTYIEDNADNRAEIRRQQGLAAVGDTVAAVGDAAATAIGNVVQQIVAPPAASGVGGGGGVSDLLFLGTLLWCGLGNTVVQAGALGYRNIGARGNPNLQDVQDIGRGRNIGIIMLTTGVIGYLYNIYPTIFINSWIIDGIKNLNLKMNMELFIINLLTSFMAMPGFYNKLVTMGFYKPFGYHLPNLYIDDNSQYLWKIAAPFFRGRFAISNAEVTVTTLFNDMAYEMLQSVPLGAGIVPGGADEWRRRKTIQGWLGNNDPLMSEEYKKHIAKEYGNIGPLIMLLTSNYDQTEILELLGIMDSAQLSISLYKLFKQLKDGGQIDQTVPANADLIDLLNKFEFLLGNEEIDLKYMPLFKTIRVYDSVNPCSLSCHLSMLKLYEFYLTRNSINFDDVGKRLKYMLNQARKHAIPGYETYNLYLDSYVSTYGGNIMDAVLTQDQTILDMVRKSALSQVTLPDMVVIGGKYIGINLLLNYIYGKYKESQAPTPEPSTPEPSTPEPEPPTPEPEPPTPPSLNCGNFDCSTTENYIRRSNPESISCVETCDLSTCCVEPSQFDGIPVGSSNCNNKCYKSEGNCMSPDNDCGKLIIPEGENKTIINNTINTIPELSLYEIGNSTNTVPDSVDTCCSYSDGITNPFGKGCKWQQELEGNNKYFNCGCYKFHEPSPKENINRIIYYNKGVVTELKSNLNQIINENFTKDLNKTIEYDIIADLQDKKLPDCLDNDNSTIQKCSDTSNAKIDIGYTDGCMWNDRKLY